VKRACHTLVVAVMGVALAAWPAFAQTCAIGGHNETSENFTSAGGGWTTVNMTPGTVPGGISVPHLCISEVAPRGAGTGSLSDSSEYVEIYNPTTRPIDLSPFYIADDPGYYKIVNGPYAVTNNSDYVLRFPAGLTLDPGRTVVICVTKQGFAGSGASPGPAQHFLEMKDSNANPADDMVNVVTNSVFLVGGGMFTNPSGTNGEWMMLFCWNGTSDLVCDVDYASWGANSASNAKADKTGICIDGPDAGAAASCYNADLAAASQTNLGSGTVLTKPNTYQRVGGGAGEAGEVLAGGNGCRGQVIPTVVDWLPVAGTNNIRFHVRWENQDPNNSSDQVNGTLRSQEFGVFLPDFGDIGSFSVPPLQPSSFFDVFVEIPLDALPPKPNKILPGGGPRPATAMRPVGHDAVASNCPPDTNWAGNVDLFWSGPGQTGQTLKHYGDLLVCPGAGPSYIHMRSSNCPNPMPWSIVGLCPGFSCTLVNEDLTPTPNPAPPGWTGYICVSSPAGTPIPTNCCFKVVFDCNGSPGTVDLCVTTCDWSPPHPTLSVVDWAHLDATTERFHLRWANTDPSSSSAPVSGTMSSQVFGVFEPNFGPIGSFSVPPIAPSSFFDIFIDIPLANLPSEPQHQLPGGGPPANSPCPPPGRWQGNVDVEWSGAGGTGSTHKHFGHLLVCPGAGPSYLHVVTACPSPAMTWSITGGPCAGFAPPTLVNEDHSPAPAVLPVGWTGWICMSAPASTPVGDSCCFQVNFDCAGSPGVIDVCAKTCDWSRVKPTLSQVDWSTINTTTERFHLRWTNDDASLHSGPVSGSLSSQLLGVFLPNAGAIGSFSVPDMAPNSFFDIFIDIPLAQLPPDPDKQLPGGGPGVNNACPPPTPPRWNGNVDVFWDGAGGTGRLDKHYGELLICPGAGPSYIHVVTHCDSVSTWTIAGLCSGFGATLVNEDHSPAPAVLPPGWSGWICVSSPPGTPVGKTCCFIVRFTCAGSPGIVEICAKTCDWSAHQPVLSAIDWTNVGTNVHFHLRWDNPSPSAPTDPMGGGLNSQAFGVFMPDFGQIGSFSVPPIQPNSFFDVFVDIPLASLPPNPQHQMPGGGPQPGSPCPQTNWAGNVDIQWNSPTGQGQVNYHFGDVLVCPAGGPTYIHTISGCASTPTWLIAGGCTGFSATLVNEDFSPAPAVLPAGWTGFICVTANAGVAYGTVCCFDVVFTCDGARGDIKVCATACRWSSSGSVPPVPAGTEFGIYAAQPNPSSNGMVIGFVLPKSGHATVDVFDLGGKHVATLFDGAAQAGPTSVRWSGQGDGGRALAPGAYFVKLNALDRISRHKVIVVH
jgi:lamin tail-like protein/flagellar hook capping protein FlgD